MQKANGVANRNAARRHKNGSYFGHDRRVMRMHEWEGHVAIDKIASETHVGELMTIWEWGYQRIRTHASGPGAEIDITGSSKAGSQGI